MPYIKPPAADLSWDAFPAPPSEAEEWQPDPDAIPVSHSVSAPHYRRGSLTVQKKRDLKRDRRLGLSSYGHSESTSASSPMTSNPSGKVSLNQGSWPFPPQRAFSPLRPSAPTAASLSNAFLAEPPTRVETILMAPEKILTTPNQPTFSIKGTMENLPVQLLPRRPHTPPKSLVSETDELPEDPPTPSWARPIAHLLICPPKSALALSTQTVPAMPVSRPPHLRRKQATSSCTTTTTTATMGSSSESFEGTNTPVQSLAVSATPSFGLPHHRRNSPDAIRPISATPVKDLKAQKTLLESFIPKSLASSPHSHERYLQTKLINLMEDEIDVPNRTTRRELEKMCEKEFQARFTECKSVHKLTWVTKHKRGAVDEMSVDSSLAFFRQEEKKQFNCFNQSTMAI